MLSHATIAYFPVSNTVFLETPAVASLGGNSNTFISGNPQRIKS